MPIWSSYPLAASLAQFHLALVDEGMWSEHAPLPAHRACMHVCVRVFVLACAHACVRARMHVCTSVGALEGAAALLDYALAAVLSPALCFAALPLSTACTRASTCVHVRVHGEHVRACTSTREHACVCTCTSLCARGAHVLEI